jgi:amino acid transporter
VAGGAWLGTLTAVATAVAWGVANALVAQAATSRLLYSMSRDRQLPRFLSKVDERRRVPVNATLLVAALSLAVGVYMSQREDGITVSSTLVNLGALSAFSCSCTSASSITSPVAGPAQSTPGFTSCPPSSGRRSSAT